MSRSASVNRPLRKKGKKETSGDKLKAKEEEYMRLNAELEAKTSELVKEADELLKDNLSILSDLEAREASDQGQLAEATGAIGTNDQEVLVGKGSSGKKGTRPVGYNRKLPGKMSKRPASSMAAGSRKTAAVVPIARATTAMQEVRSSGIDPDLLAVIRRLEIDTEEDMDMGGEGGGVRQPARVTNYEDLLPPAMDNMGSEATIRFLKAKLRVMQEEMDSLCQEFSTKDKLVATQEAKLKELEVGQAKMERSLQTASNQAAKHKKVAEELKHKCEGLEGQLTSLRKDYEALKLSQKKASSQHGVLDVRLNRALEEVEKYKTALQSCRSQAKEEGKLEREKNEQLTKENRRLEKQKAELVAGFKKQMKLIDILKRQKMHVEAAKMLSFSEDEFMKALDWGSN